MSNSVTTAIRGSVRDMAIGKTKTSEKADRATVEQVMHDSHSNAQVFSLYRIIVIHLLFSMKSIIM